MKAGLTEREREEYRQTFKKFDTDGSNTIDTQELGQMIRVLGSVSACLHCAELFTFLV